MTKSFAILGRQPAIGLAELEALYGADKVQPVGKVAAIIDTDPSNINFARLGSTMKFGKLLTTLDTTDWRKIEDFLLKAIPEHAQSLDEGKLKLGFSTYDLRVNPKQLLATGLKAKKLLKKDGRSCRLVPNKNTELNSAQVIHNGLTRRLGWEILLVADRGTTYVAQTIAVQDIDAYAARDHGRPMRDAKVGMLPPKLAQTIINLTQPDDGNTILDPFCGTGVVLQEAMLMGYKAYGSDLEPRMIEYSRANLDWLKTTRTFQNACGQQPETEVVLEVANACEHSWQPFDIIACEAYLGRPFAHEPKPETLKDVMQDVNTITSKFLKNAAKQVKPGQRLCVAVPAWHVDGTTKHLRLLDSLEELGYNRAVFKNASNGELIYHREGQIVGRELVVLIRK